MQTHPLSRNLLAGLMIVLLTLTTGCANKKPGEPLHTAESNSSDASSSGTFDPIESFNRGMFRFNEIFDGVIFKPAAHIYNGLVPPVAQKSVKNALVNLSAPVIFINSVLQADAPNAGRTLGRFVINSTVGIVGLFDVATPMGIQKQHNKDFGQTLGVYGVGTGPYIVLPILGPSNLRDTVGIVVDFFDDPFTYIFTNNETLGREVLDGVVTRLDLLPLTDRLYRDSFDPYSTFRSIYTQHRAKVVRDYKVRDSGDLQKETGN